MTRAPRWENDQHTAGPRQSVPTIAGRSAAALLHWHPGENSQLMAPAPLITIKPIITKRMQSPQPQHPKPIPMQCLVRLLLRRNGGLGFRVCQVGFLFGEKTSTVILPQCNPNRIHPAENSASYGCLPGVPLQLAAMVAGSPYRFQQEWV
jgi:hypothetical protein